MKSSQIVNHIGNEKLLALPKTAFLCSRKVPAAVILKCYDWAKEQRDFGRCVISGFHSTIEKDVFHFLRKGTQPIIMVLAHAIGKKLAGEFAKELDSGRLLIATPFGPEQKRGDRRTAAIRNSLMVELADDVVVGHASPGGRLETTVTAIWKPFRIL